MINIDEFENLANEIIESTSKKDFLNWLDIYRTEKANCINFETISVSFKAQVDLFNYTDNNSNLESIRYSLAA